MPNRSSYQTYTVVKGDTLAAIAKRFGSSVSAIATASGVTDPNKISVGQNLLIPVAPDDLSEVVVNVKPRVTSAPKSPPRASVEPPTISLAEYARHWFEPPRLWFTLATLAAAAYYLLAPQHRRKR